MEGILREGRGLWPIAFPYPKNKSKIDKTGLICYNQPMRFMSIDYGLKRIGYSISDRTAVIAGESKTIPSGSGAVSVIYRLCRDEEVTNVVIGLAFNSRGEEGEMCREARKFGAALDSLIKDGSVRIEYFDETLTTAASHKVLIEANMSRKKRKDIVDGLAAKILLQKYLDDFNMKAGRIIG